MNLLRIIAFILALITVVVTSDDILSEKLVKDYTAQLQRSDVVDAAVKFALDPLYSDLASLQHDYPGFTPVIAPWTKGGSAYLYHLGLGGGPGKYSITLPEQRIIVDRNGTPETVLWCVTGEGQCEVTPPAGHELGVIGTFFYSPDEADESATTRTGKAAPTPAIDIAAYWQTQGQVETLAHCMWAYSSDIREQTLTVESVKHRAAHFESLGLSGFYRIAIEFVPEADDDISAPPRYTHIERLTREQFFAQKDCLAGHAANTDRESVGP